MLVRERNYAGSGSVATTNPQEESPVVPGSSLTVVLLSQQLQQDSCI